MTSALNSTAKRVAIVGSGPAGLMAAHVVASAGHQVQIFEKKRGPGKKLLIAGSSGLNITYDAPLETFHTYYPEHSNRIRAVLEEFSPSNWISFIENLGIQTFKGTSNRYFVKGLKASGLLRAWLIRLQNLGAEILYQQECTGFEINPHTSKVHLGFAGGQSREFDAVCFCLGGGSYEPKEKPLRWPPFFKSKGLKFDEFRSSNVGYRVAWPEKLVEEADGLPVKNTIVQSERGVKSGDLVITKYGIEGTPIYYCGMSGNIHLDLKPDLSLEQIIQKLNSSKENLSPIRRVKKYLNLSPGALALVFHMTPQGILNDIPAVAARLKSFPLTLIEAQPLDEAISSTGGLNWDELDDHLMLKRFPGVFAAGEMLNWDAPTGGFLIQACVSQGYTAGKGILNKL